MMINSATNDPIIIYSVSTILTQDNYMQFGSLFGGTTIYIRGTGFDQSSDNNYVTIGPYNCDIARKILHFNFKAKGVNEVFLSCITEPATDPKYLVGLPVVVTVAGKGTSTCKGSC